jgi:glucosylglycerate hydrolase
MSATETIHEAAIDVLRRNDAGGWTKPAPDLYPHQWSWDAAFVAIGLAHLDPRRAAAELEHLFTSRWASGKLPHIVFARNGGEDYYPGPDVWGRQECVDARGAMTSGLCQPPVHALAVARLVNVADHVGGAAAADTRDFAANHLRTLFEWHRYLVEHRDPEGSGLLTIFHPWESGMDNAPQWDAPLSALTIGDRRSRERTDLVHVSDASQRPTEADYDRYLWLVDRLRDAGYDDERILADHPFLVKDVFMSGILVAANEALAELVEELVDAPQTCEQLRSWASRGRRGLADAYDPATGLCLNRDVRTGERLTTRAVGGLAAIVAGGVHDATERAISELASDAFAGHPDLRWPVPPSVPPDADTFESRNYWRGPVWPVMNWLLWWSLTRLREHDAAAGLREAGLEQIAAAGFPEYMEPFTGEPLGSPDQSWTAAVTIDWLDAGDLPPPSPPRNRV